MRVEYKVDGRLIDVLHVAYEVRCTTGMEPDALVLSDGKRVKFNYGDFRLLNAEDISEKEYVDRNSIYEE